MSETKNLYIDLSEHEDAEDFLRQSLSDEITKLQLQANIGEMPISVLSEKILPALRELSLLEGMDDSEPSCDHRTDTLWTQAPNLTRLHLRSGRPMFHSVSHPKVELLKLEAAPLCDDGQWDMPALRVLDYDPHVESECDIQAVDLLWRQKLPALRQLLLRGLLTTSTPTLERAEVRQFLAGLERLWIPAGAVLPYEKNTNLIQHLIEQAPYLQHLKQLVVTQIYQKPTAENLALLQQRLPNAELIEGSGATVSTDK